MKNERWAEPAEIRRALSPDEGVNAGGPILDYRNGKRWAFTKEGHTIFLGMSGVGKSRRGTIPMILSFIRSMVSFVVADSKGEIYRQTACYLDKKYRWLVINFRDIFSSLRWNPLAHICELYRSGEPRKKQTALELLDNLAIALYPVHEKADPFWAESARSAFISAAIILLDNAEPAQVTIANIYQFFARGDERCGMSTYLKKLVSDLPEGSTAGMLLSGYVNAPNDTRGSIKTTLLEGISTFARSEGLVSMLSADDLHINDLDGETPTAIYIILPDESKNYDALCGVLCGQLLMHYVRMAHDKYGGRLPRQLNVCLEELGNIGKAIGSLSHLLSAARSRNIRLQLVLQNLAQLDTIYGPSEASTIRSNADILVAYRINHWETLTELSHKCGEREVEVNDRWSREPLITPAGLGAMETGQALVMISGKTKFITRLPDYTEMYDVSGWRPPEEIVRTEVTRVQPFDIRTYVMELKKKKTDNAPSEITSMLSGSQSPSLANLDIDQLMADVDKKLKELDKEEKAKNDDKLTQETVFELVIFDAGENKTDVIKALRRIEGTDRPQAMKAVASTPYTVQFKSKQRAMAAREMLEEAGATVFSNF